MESVPINPEQWFEFNSGLTSFGNDQWQTGGMTSNGLKDAGTINNYFYTPGRSTILPNASQENAQKSISSIGFVQNNGLKDNFTYGPGSLLSTNVGNRNPAGSSSAAVGKVSSAPNKEQFVNYRDTDPALVDNLRNNPLSIYASGNNVKNAQIPAFFVDTKPANFSGTVHKRDVPVSRETATLYVDNSPNVAILGMANQNPFMGLGPIVANQPTFPGKAYGGNDDGTSGSKISAKLYNSVWTMPLKSTEHFNGKTMCQNKALMNFAPGYDVAINKDVIITDGPVSYQNLPWGPIKVTGDPRTQQGGVWQRGDNPWPTKNHQNSGVMSTAGVRGNAKVQKPFVNPYAGGMPGTLIP